MKLGTAFKKLRLSSNSIILLKKGTEVADPDVISDLVENLGKTNLSNIILVVVEDLDDLSIISEREMNEHGWFRTSALSRIIHADPGKKNGNPAEPKEGDDGT